MAETESARPPDAYGVFCGPIDETNTRELMRLFCGANNAKQRITSARAVFMIHRAFTKAGETLPAMTIPGIERNLILSDENTESILRENITLPVGKQWSDLDRHDFYFSGVEAVQMGLAHEIGEFAPPPGTGVYHFFSEPDREKKKGK